MKCSNTNVTNGLDDQFITVLTMVYISFKFTGKYSDLFDTIYY